MYYWHRIRRQNARRQTWLSGPEVEKEESVADEIDFHETPPQMLTLDGVSTSVVFPALLSLAQPHPKTDSPQPPTLLFSKLKAVTFLPTNPAAGALCRASAFIFWAGKGKKGWRKVLTGRRNSLLKISRVLFTYHGGQSKKDEFRLRSWFFFQKTLV